jgi:hypothetical protein
MANQAGLSVHSRTRRRTARVSDAGEVFKSLFRVEFTALGFKVERFARGE